MPKRSAWWVALAAAALALGACAHPWRAPGPAPPFAGPGRLLLLLESERGTQLALLTASDRRHLDAAGVLRARWVSPHALLLLVEGEGAAESEGTYGAPDTRLRVLSLRDGTLRDVGPVGRHYDPEPSPDGQWLAVGAETPGLGDSDLEIWSLAEPFRRVAVRHQSMEQPRWRADGRALVASVLMADPESDDSWGGSFGGTGFRWPRMHSLRRDLGDPAFVWDGAQRATLAPGGSLPLWWDARGLFARQSRGLVRCDLEAQQCALVFATEPSRRVVDGRAAGPDAAWLLSVEARDAFDRRQPDELLHVALPDGALRDRWKPAPGTWILDLDWAP
jgi:hypothetical protein